MIALMHSLCKNPTGKDVDERFFREGGETYVFKGIGILDAVGADHLDSHQLPIHRPLANTGHPLCGRGNTIRSSEATVGDPMALWQEATVSGDFPKPV